MRIRYCAIIGDEDRREFESVERMQIFLITNSDRKDDGELFVANWGIRISYNTRTGEVKFMANNENQYISLDYNTPPFQSSLIPVKQAICHVACWHILDRLYKLGDLEICKKIQEHHPIDAKGNVQRQIDNSTVISTLSQILKLVKPKSQDSGMYLIAKLFSHENEKSQTLKQKAVFEVFQEVGLYDQGFDLIKSKDFANGLMENIEQRINTTQINNETKSSQQRSAP